MRALVGGPVVAVGDVRPYTREDGTAAASVDVFFASSDPRFKPDRVSMDPSIAPSMGETVWYRANVRARAGKFGPYESVWCTERVDVQVTAHAPKLAAAK